MNDKIIRYKCDLCDREYSYIQGGTIFLKGIEQVELYPYGRRKERIKVMVCPDCQKKIKEMMSTYETD